MCEPNAQRHSDVSGDLLIYLTRAPIRVHVQAVPGAKLTATFVLHVRFVLAALEHILSNRVQTAASVAFDVPTSTIAAFCVCATYSTVSLATGSD